MDSVNFPKMWIYFLAIYFHVGSLSATLDQVCTQHSLNNNLEIRCSAIPLETELEKTNYLITHETIICGQSNMTTSRLTVNPTINLQRLVFFHFENCLISEFPENYFRNLVKLESVTLDNLPVTKLWGNAFDNSSNLIELTLSRLRQLEIIHPRFLGQQWKLETLSLIESDINPVQLRPVLLSLYITLKNLYWRRNVKKLWIFENYFHNFEFENLVLEYNGIENVDFLKFVSTKYLSLKGNPIGKYQQLNISNYVALSQTLTILDLSDTQTDQIFADSENAKFPYMTELILRDNLIEEIPNKLHTFLPSLKILDLRNNKFAFIPELDYMLRIKFGRVYLKGNRFHCNCHMKWVQSFDEKQIQDLYCQVMEDFGNSTKLSLVSRHSHQLHMACTAPILHLEVNDKFQYINDSTAFVNDTIKIYRIDVHPGEITNWKCVGQGDPAPRLKWVRNQRTVKTAQPPLNKHKTETILSNLMISYRNFQSADEAVYSCKARNVVGNAEVQLRARRKTGRRIIEPQAQMGNLYQDKNRSGKTPIIMPLFMITLSIYWVY